MPLKTKRKVQKVRRDGFFGLFLARFFFISFVFRELYSISMRVTHKTGVKLALFSRILPLFFCNLGSNSALKKTQKVSLW